jgi:hypothetical protein
MEGNMSSHNIEVRSIAIIGSFRQHYAQVCQALRIFQEGGLIVKSPKGDPIVEEDIPFVRFTSDVAEHDDNVVQSVTLHRILQADLTYVVTPGGYIGRTTCYEVGRIIQANKPIYFSERPTDLPINVPDSHVCGPEDIIELFVSHRLTPQWLFATDEHPASILERQIRDGNLGQY